MPFLRFCLWCAAAVQLIHILALPFVAVPNPDGSGIGSEVFVAGSSFPSAIGAASPIYDVFIGFGDWLVDGRVEAILLVNVCLAVLTFACLGRVIAKLAGGLSAALAVVLLSILPLFVASQHVYTGEIATVCMVSLVALLSLNFFNSLRLPELAVLCIVSSLAYYVHPALFFLGPCVSLLLFLTLFSGRHADPRDFDEGSRPLYTLVASVVLTVVPLAVSFPWSGFSSPPMSSIATPQSSVIESPQLLSASPISSIARYVPVTGNRDLIRGVFRARLPGEAGAERKLDSAFVDFERGLFVINMSSWLFFAANGMLGVLLLFSLLRRDPGLAILPSFVLVLYVADTVLMGGARGLMVPAQILLFAGAVLFFGRALGWMFLPVFSKAHPLTDRHERIREVIATRLLEDALDEPRGLSFPRRANR